ncbi:MAG: hypothetical protein JXR64_14010 [Spirochaetales bacterium]|nr:hypothetical protein [Spirochaetales bacterium]
MDKLLDGVDVELKALEDVLTIKNGKGYKEFKEGNIPVYGSGGIMTYIGQILIPR